MTKNLEILRQCARPFSLLFLLLLIVGCGGEIQVATKGCNDCPDRCLVPLGSSQGRCVRCLNDSQCQEENSPTRRCTEDYRCVCGSEKDCPEGQFCKGVECQSFRPARIRGQSLAKQA